MQKDIMGSVDSSIFGARPIIGSKTQDISGFAASILTIVFVICLSQVPQLYGNAVLNHLSAHLTQLPELLQ